MGRTYTGIEVCVSLVLQSLVLQPLLRLAEGASDNCWIGPLQYDTCCLPPPRGNDGCWDGTFTYERCCSTRSVGAGEGGASAPPRTAVDINSIEEISELGGCELNIFQEFKARAGAWYKKGTPNLALFHEFGYIVRRFDSMYRSCAPGALTALLLKLELMYFEEDWRFNELFAMYTERHHEAVASGQLLQSHHVNGWPLVEGLRRVNVFRALGQHKSEIEPVHEPVLDIVVCYCGRGERVDWIKGFHRLPWRDEDRSRSMKAKVALRFYHKCGSSNEVEREKERQQLVTQWGPFFHTVEVRYVDDLIRADDCSAYLAYIVDRYHDLPEMSVFLHADAPEHIPTLDLLMDTVYAGSRGYLPSNVGFAHLAHNYVHHDCPGATHKCEHKEAYEVSRLWKNVFASSIVPSMVDGDLNAYCCVQFLVRRERILLRDKAFYSRVLNYFGQTPASYFALFPVGKVVWAPDTRGRTPCQLAMYIWHVMFGEDIRLPRRHRDPRLPLFMRMLNIETEAVREAQLGADGGDGSGLEITNDRSQAEETYYRLQSLFAPSSTDEQPEIKTSIGHLVI